MLERWLALLKKSFSSFLYQDVDVMKAVDHRGSEPCCCSFIKLDASASL